MEGTEIPTRAFKRFQVRPEGDQAVIKF